LSPREDRMASGADLQRSLNAVVLGKHAETVYRDKAGRKIDPKLEWVKRREEERRKTQRSWRGGEGE